MEESPSPKRDHALDSGPIGEDENDRPENKDLKKWRIIFSFLCLLELLVDPMFAYTLFIDPRDVCFTLDVNLLIVVISIRCVTELVYVIYIIAKTWFSFVDGNPKKKLWDKAKTILSILVDLFAAAPIPQVLLFVKKSYSELLAAIRIMKYVIIAQYVPIIVRLFLLHSEVMGWNNIRRRMVYTAWAKSAFNLALYILASHVIGALWYVSAVQRLAACCQEAYKVKSSKSKIPVLECAYDSGFPLRIEVLREYCLVNPPNANGDHFDFGIYVDALHLGIWSSKGGFFRKILYSFLWGLQSLRGLGLKTSADIEEIMFAVVISISGLVLFALLIGNMQALLQSRAKIMEKIRLETEEIEEWMSFQSFPHDLKKKIRVFQVYVWRNRRGLDVKSLLISLPRELSRDIKRHFCQDGLRNVPMVQHMNEQVLDEIYDCLKPTLYMKNSHVAREGYVLDEIIIITNGMLYVGESTNTNTTILHKGDVYGQELFAWAFCNSSSSSSDCPLSTKTLKTGSKVVEAFVLTTSDLLQVISKQRSLTTQTDDSPNSVGNLKDGADSTVPGNSQDAAVNLATTAIMAPNFGNAERSASQHRRSKQSEQDGENIADATSDATNY